MSAAGSRAPSTDDQGAPLAGAAVTAHGRAAAVRRDRPARAVRRSNRCPPGRTSCARTCRASSRRSASSSMCSRRGPSAAPVPAGAPASRRGAALRPILAASHGERCRRPADPRPPSRGEGSRSRPHRDGVAGSAPETLGAARHQEQAVALADERPGGRHRRLRPEAAQNGYSRSCLRTPSLFGAQVQFLTIKLVRQSGGAVLRQRACPRRGLRRAHGADGAGIALGGPGRVHAGRHRFAGCSAAATSRRSAGRQPRRRRHVVRGAALSTAATRSRLPAMRETSRTVGAHPRLRPLELDARDGPHGRRPLRALRLPRGRAGCSARRASGAGRTGRA